MEWKKNAMEIKKPISFSNECIQLNFPFVCFYERKKISFFFNMLVFFYIQKKKWIFFLFRKSNTKQFIFNKLTYYFVVQQRKLKLTYNLWSMWLAVHFNRYVNKSFCLFQVNLFLNSRFYHPFLHFINKSPLSFKGLVMTIFYKFLIGL